MHCHSPSARELAHYNSTQSHSHSLRLRNRRRRGLYEHRAVVYNGKTIAIFDHIETSEWQCYTVRLVLTWLYFLSLAVSVSWLTYEPALACGRG